MNWSISTQTCTPTNTTSESQVGLSMRRADTKTTFLVWFTQRFTAKIVHRLICRIRKGSSLISISNRCGKHFETFYLEQQLDVADQLCVKSPASQEARFWIQTQEWGPLIGAGKLLGLNTWLSSWQKPMTFRFQIIEWTLINIWTFAILVIIIKIW